MKSKKILTILLSLAIMFTFMPAMAFADVDPGDVTGWGAKYATVTDSNQTEFVTKRVFSDGVGTMTATPQNKKIVGETYTAPSETKTFYDFDNAFFSYGDADLNKTTWTKAEFDKFTAKTTKISLNVVDQSYSESYPTDADKADYKVSTADKYSVEGTYDGTKNTVTFEVGLWAVTASVTKYDTTKATEDQTIALDVTGIAFTGNSSSTRIPYEGSIAGASFTVKGTPKDPASAAGFFDSADSATTEISGTTVTLYDGAAHTFMVEPVDGWTPSYSVWDQKAGQYVSQTSVSITDVSDDDVAVEVKWTKAGATAPDASKTEYFDINLLPAQAVGFQFVEGVETTGTTRKYSIVGSEYDAWSFVEFVPVTIDTTSATYKSATDQQKKDMLAVNAANSKAANANAAALLEAFKSYVDVKATVSKSNPDIVSLKFDSKDLTEAQRKELAVKYAQLLKNFGLDPETKTAAAFESATYNEASLTLNSELVDTEVEFTSAPTSKIYKGSKTTKKGKLKKAQSFTVKAVCNKGYDVSYKLINANSKIKINKTTGKITLKKGLAKGTYKIKVKAYVPGVYNANDTQIAETQAITIKIKK